jgi:hypothetical protein
LGCGGKEGEFAVRVQAAPTHAGGQVHLVFMVASVQRLTRLCHKEIGAMPGTRDAGCQACRPSTDHQDVHSLRHCAIPQFNVARYFIDAPHGSVHPATKVCLSPNRQVLTGIVKAMCLSVLLPSANVAAVPLVGVARRTNDGQAARALS